MTKEQEVFEKVNRIRIDFFDSKYKDVHTDDELEEKYKALGDVLNMLKEKDNIINKVEKETREHIGFENRLKRENREPDLFNQGRFYVANNINNILKGKVKNEKEKRNRNSEK